MSNIIKSDLFMFLVIFWDNLKCMFFVYIDNELVEVIFCVNREYWSISCI